jgi:hypothetical protein
LLKRDQSCLLQRRHNQQDRVGASHTCFEELVLVDDEVLAEQRKGHGRSDGRQMFERAVEKRRFRENGDCRGATVLVLARNANRVVIDGEHAL